MIEKLDQDRAVKVPQKGLQQGLDYREPPRVGRGNPRTWVQKFYQNRSGILVLAVAQGSRFVAVVFRHGVLLSVGRPNVEAWNY